MLEITFFLEDDIREITGYELGGVNIGFDGKEYKLVDKKYYFMVFLSAIGLLDSTHAFYLSKDREKKIYFSDSSFYINIKRMNKDIIELYIMDQYIGEFSNTEFMNSIFNSCNNLYLNYKDLMKENNFFVIDMKDSLNNFISQISSKN